MLALLGASVFSSTPIVIDPSAGARGRVYDGIGGLSNSCAPWLRSYREPQRSDILDALFLPRHAGAMQVLKIEIGGDGHSTINTESSHRHSEHEPPSFERGWELWLASEARRRNPAIRLGALAWAHPGWTAGDVNKTTEYLASWVAGVKASRWNLTIDFLGLQNEGSIPGGAPTFATALRRRLDAAGLTSTLIDCCDSHNFAFVSELVDNTTEYFRAVGALAVHEPLRSAESVPADALATGKPIWSSEAYTTFSDSNGGGCWARALNWGWVKGSVTSHIAWNLIQAYPSIGSGMNYNGHGLMWAEVPWAGHYVVNAPIWVTAHYTQATEVGWLYLPVGEGSGMLEAGGSYVTLAPAETVANGDNDAATFTTVLQAMEHTNSECYKDEHPPFAVRNSTVQFQLAPGALRALQARHAISAGSATALTLSARRSLLLPGDAIDPYHPFLPRNDYFAPLPHINVDPTTGVFEVPLDVNSIVTITSLPAGAGQRGPADAGLPLVPPATPWPSSYCDALTQYPVDRGMDFAMDQMGVFEAGISRDPATTTTTMQQTVTGQPVDWHHSNFQHPQTFVGPSMDVDTEGTDLRVAVSVLPGATGWAGVGVGGQVSKGHSDQEPAASVLAVWANGSWTYAGARGSYRTSTSGWASLAIYVTGGGAAQAVIEGMAVASCASKAFGAGSFAFLAASFAPTQNERAEFTQLCINGTATVPPAPSTPTPVPPTPPTPVPPPGQASLSLASCDATDPRQQWIFTGEDGGEPGTMSPASNSSACLDVRGGPTPPVKLGACAEPAPSDTMWTWSSVTGQFASVEQLPCLVKSHGKTCHMCLDAYKGEDQVGIFDCKSGDANQRFVYDEAAGAGPVRHEKLGRCLSY